MKLKLFFVIFFLCFFFFGVFLDVTQQPKKSDIIFCLGGEGNSRVFKSVELLKNNFSKKNKLYMSGKKKNILYNIRKKKDIVQFILNHNVIFVENLKNTMAEIMYLDALMLKNNYSSVLIVTDPPHTRRVDLMIKEFTRNLHDNYTIVGSNAQWWNKNLYFTNFKSIKFVCSELIKIVYNSVKYSLFELFNKDVYRSDKIIQKT